MTNPRKIITAALAATIALTMLSISTPASAWGRCGAASAPYSYGYYGSAYPSGYDYYGSGNYGYYGGANTAPVAAEGYHCATPVKTCLLSEPGWLGTGCSCAVSCGRARGIVE